MNPKPKKKGQNGTNNNDKKSMVNAEHGAQIALQNGAGVPPSSRFQHSNVIPKFVGSLSILHAVVDAINTKIFCNNLDDMELEWCDKLMTRKAVTYKIISLTTIKTYIRLSKSLFDGNATRKQLVETVLYEMLHLYLTAQARTSDENDLQVYLISCAIDYFSNTFDMDLKINHNFDVHRIDRKSSSGSRNDSLRINATSTTKNDNDVQAIIELLGGTTLEFIPVSRKRDPIVRIVNKKLIIKNQDQFQCQKNCITCQCPPTLIMRERYLGAKIFNLFPARPDTIDCILCGCKVKRQTLSKHFDNECFVFKVSQIIYDKLNV